MASSLNTPDVLTQPIAENGDKNTIPSTNDQSLGQMSQSTGFPAICSERIADGGKAPRRADFNGAFNMLSRYIFFNQNGGVETFRADVSTAIGGYPKDAILGYKTATEFKLVRSLIANNTYNFNTTPSYIDDGSHWESVIPISKNISNWSTNVSNCITEIPQDIKLEFNNNTLTLKAGSKVYVPNGVNNFDVINIESDISRDFYGSSTVQVYLITDTLGLAGASNVVSGTTVPSSGRGLFYNLTTNIIKTYTDGTEGTQVYSFPLCVITMESNQITSIAQVFNGFGYIGTAWFMLPGVKGIVPNGFNSDGTCKNIEFTNPSVYVYTSAASAKRTVGVIIDTSGNITTALNGRAENVLNGTQLPAIVSTTYMYCYYKTDENQWYTTSGSTTANWTKFYPFYVGTRTDDGTTISEFTTKTTFHAVDYNDREFIGHQAMPSGRRADLTLGASGASYTATSDGYFVIEMITSSSSSHCTVVKGTYHIADYSGNLGIYNMIIPVSKNQTITISYGDCSIFWFYFEYANGAV